MDRVTFFVPGRPRAKGSMKFIRAGNRSVPVTNKNLETWQGDVKLFALQAMEGRMITGGCRVSVVATFRRPKNHYRTGKFSHLLRDDSPDRMLKKPDPDKLIRALLDAMTEVVYIDDCEVDTMVLHKRWGAPEGVEITVKGVCYAVQGERREEEKGEIEKPEEKEEGEGRFVT